MHYNVLMTFGAYIATRAAMNSVIFWFVTRAVTNLKIWATVVIHTIILSIFGFQITKLKPTSWKINVNKRKTRLSHGFNV